MRPLLRQSSNSSAPPSLRVIDVTVLVSVADGACHGAAIDDIIRQRHGSAATLTSIYTTLARLHEWGLISTTERCSRGATHGQLKCFTITSVGLEITKRELWWVRAMLRSAEAAGL